MTVENGFVAWHIDEWGIRPPRYEVKFVSQCHACRKAMRPGELGSFDVRSDPNLPMHYYCLKQVMWRYRWGAA